MSALGEGCTGRSSREPSLNTFPVLAQEGPGHYVEAWASPVWGGGQGRRGRRGLYSEVLCILGDGHMGPPVERQTRLETLPSHNFVGSFRLVANFSSDDTIMHCLVWYSKQIDFSFWPRVPIIGTSDPRMSPLFSDLLLKENL